MDRKFLSLALGLVLTMLSAGRAMGAINNPSFEADGDLLWLDSGNATGWTDNVASPFGGNVAAFNYHTDGLYGARVFTTTSGTFSAGTDARVSQSVDLTGVGQLLFDAKLSVHSYTISFPSWQSFAEAAFYVDSTMKWSSQTPGTYADQAIDVTGLSGLHTLSFRLQANSAGSGGDDISNWFEFDNVRAVPEPASLSLLALGGLALLGRRRRA